MTLQDHATLPQRKKSIEASPFRTRIFVMGGFCTWKDFVPGGFCTWKDLVHGRILCWEDFVHGRILCWGDFVPGGLYAGRILYREDFVCLLLGEDFVLGGKCTGRICVFHDWEDLVPGGKRAASTGTSTTLVEPGGTTNETLDVFLRNNYICFLTIQPP